MRFIKDKMGETNKIEYEILLKWSSWRSLMKMKKGVGVTKEAPLSDNTSA